MALKSSKFGSFRRRRPRHEMAPQTRALRGRSRRRGTVLVMVIGILAMLFIIGATQLLVARFERQSAEQKRSADNLEGVAASMIVPALAQMRQDVVGDDGVAYNAANQVHNASNPPVEDYADFAGAVAVGGNTFQNGDLLMASLEPYADPTVNGVYWWFASSWAMDAAPAGATLPSRVQALPASPTAGDFGDADGDGVLDSNSLGLGMSAPFGGAFRLFQKIVPHTGMVLMDRMTHPALLSQVIHPSDSGYHKTPWLLFQGNSVWSRTDDDEIRMRRRGMLPGSVSPGTTEWGTLATNDLRSMLPFTLGYDISGSWSGVTPHWWPVPEGDFKEFNWYTDRMTPGTGLTEGYSATSDVYDRQHLITTRGSDDVFRPQRDEQGGSIASVGPPAMNATPGMFIVNATVASEAPLRQLYYMVAPEASAGLDPLSFNKYPPTAYGRPVDYTGALGDLLFNKPGQRTAFSLRDVLVDASTSSPWNGGFQASYRRAVQLTAYYLAMMQHTDGWPIVTPDPRVVAAAQLAVNTIDFADNYDENNSGLVDSGEVDEVTRFQFTLGDGTILDVCGVERQPYITEAYAKVVHMPDPATFPLNPQWIATPGVESIYAIELYNPYDTELDLNDYAIEVGVGASVASFPLAGLGIKIPAYRYIVIADQTNDPNLAIPLDPFVEGADVGPGADQNLFTISGFEIAAGQPVSLIRTRTALLLPAGGASAGPPVVVDRIEPVPGGFGGSNWAKADVTVRVPTDATTDRLVRDTSLQRRKEWRHVTGASMPTAQFPPQYWQFTLSKQMLLPLPWHEEPVTLNPSALTYDINRPAQHNLLGTGTGLANTASLAGMFLNDMTFSAVAVNQALVAAAFDGLEVAFKSAPLLYARIGAAPVPVASFPVIVSDRGLDRAGLAATPSTVACAAFPTTGSLLLVTRNGPTTYNGFVDNTRPLTYTAAEGYNGGTKPSLTLVDQGHMPVFSYAPVEGMGKTTDLAENRGRLNVPWGQLVFDYFTALPLEELVFLNSANFENQYVSRFGEQVSGNAVSLYPMVDLTEPGVPVGVKVRGRVNINFAPWWVLDGLPILPDAVPGTTSANAPPEAASPAVPSGSLALPAGLPVSELLSGRLDPVDVSVNAQRAGASFVDALFDNTLGEGLTNAQFPTIGPEFARYIVSYRENRPVKRPDGLFVDALNSGPPGLVGVGGLCSLIASIQTPSGLVHSSGFGNVPVTAANLIELRWWYDMAGGVSVNVAARPFSYVGYLQMIAPIVRLQDWATVKGHVFTIYSVIGDTSDPQVWLRSQTTVDRTRCLYSNDLPDRILQSDVLGFYNAVTDQ